MNTSKKQHRLGLLILISAILLTAASLFAAKFTWSGLFIVEGTKFKCDDSWLENHDKSKASVREMSATAVFSWDDIDENFSLQFQVNNPNNKDIWSEKKWYSESSQCASFTFDAEVNGAYDVTLYIDGQKYDSISFKSVD